MPLANERYAAEPGPVRSDDLRKQREEFKRFQDNCDPRQNRELTPQEIAHRDRVNAWYEKYKQDEAREAADKARRVAEEKAHREREEFQARQEREAQARRARLAQFELAEALEDDLRERMGFEKQELKWRLL